MSPVTYLERAELTIIRPLIYVPEKDIKYFAKKEGLPVVKSPCPADGVTRRETTKQLIYKLEKEIPSLSSHLFGAIERSEIDGWNARS